MKVTRSEDWTPEMLVAACDAIAAHNRRNEGHPISSPRAAAIVCDRIMSGFLRAAYIDGYLVVYDVGPTWSTEDDLFYELLLIHVNPAEGNFADYVDGLRELAKHHRCYGIVTGNGVLRPGLRRRYERAGFSLFNESYYLEV
ncbi:hypothetical protein X534_gp32 [Ralstonia phage RSB3]|uniref:Uncharacterized protein n=1 Tax=Ralstonia phage RSB3 TaxID=1402875 RepID=U3TK84_9CAUD|nr:hypothetical protein X534_gp32 [Ralstonia phage RSB3]BAN92343.1 hypothetical protein [Ralstonia phage RSB3]